MEHATRAHGIVESDYRGPSRRPRGLANHHV